MSTSGMSAACHRAARANREYSGRQPLDIEKVEAIITLIQAGASPVEAARQLGLGRSIVHREIRQLGASRAV